jgi:hypothetical protein
MKESVDLARTAMGGDDLEALRKAVEELQQLAYRMTEVMYERLGGDAPPGSTKSRSAITSSWTKTTMTTPSSAERPPPHADRFAQRWQAG